MDWTKFGPRPRHKYTAAELRALYQACRTPEMRAALWEINRLHAIVKKADHLCRALTGIDGEQTDLILISLMNTLKDEPCIHEDPARSITDAMEYERTQKGTHR
ncbi:hypothetical protein [Cupriavidus campinensis]|uniref:Uncharacterized protein n=1 Tax=Cupriavidus campinensis TaxID=151783 RepID=A0ABY3ET32_9BURK|nr:hypothetical protein [Cupriavidus campinensis]TSP14060.1 hypothetical protein FGG12_06210 [Cupriavidus campinensis]